MEEPKAFLSRKKLYKNNMIQMITESFFKLNTTITNPYTKKTPKTSTFSEYTTAFTEPRHTHKKNTPITLQTRRVSRFYMTSWRFS